MKTKPLPILLAVSLAINLVFIGLFSGILMKRLDGTSSHRSQLTNEERQFTRTFFQQAYATTRPQSDLRNNTRKSIYEAITSENFDIAELRELLAELEQNEVDLRAQLHENLISNLPNMTDAERNLIANRIFVRRRGPQRNHRPDRRPRR